MLFAIGREAQPQQPSAIGSAAPKPDAVAAFSRDPRKLMRTDLDVLRARRRLEEARPPGLAMMEPETGAGDSAGALFVRNLRDVPELNRRSADNRTPYSPPPI